VYWTIEKFLSNNRLRYANQSSVHHVHIKFIHVHRPSKKGSDTFRRSLIWLVILSDVIEMPSFGSKKKLTKEHIFRVTIPMEIVDELGWNVNDVVRIGLEGDKIVITALKV
jgi:hypothetical protein